MVDRVLEYTIDQVRRTVTIYTLFDNQEERWSALAGLLVTEESRRHYDVIFVDLFTGEETEVNLKECECGC